MWGYGLLMGAGIALATAFGALIGFGFKQISHKTHDGMMGFAAGVMLAASVFGLIEPAAGNGSTPELIVMIAGVLAGAGFVSAADRLVPHLHSVVGIRPTDEHASSRLNKVLLFVLAIAIHNFPEGMAVGVGFGGGEISHALMVALGIALQNIPEGFVVIFPLLQTGMSRPRVLGIALLTGLVELVGTIVGILLTSVSATLLPFLLAFAGGTMLYIICDEIVPDTHAHGYEKIATFCLIGGFLLMMIMDAML